MKLSLTEYQYQRIQTRITCENILEEMVFKISLLTEDGKTKPDMEWDFTEVKKDIDLSKLWVKTKEAKAKHLTWDLYKDEEEYYKFKINNPGIWNHGEYCDYLKII
jgi:hypothetical protein